MTAALIAAIEGARTLLIEKTSRIGGTTARSSGTVWIPDNPEQRRRGISGDAASARTYLQALAGDRADASMIEAFLAAGPLMLDYLEQHAHVRFRCYEHAPDYRQEFAGAAQGGRPLEPLPFDGRTLGKDFERVGTPLPELMLLGGMMVTRGEAAQLVRSTHSLKACMLGVRLLLRYGVDRLRFRRGTRLVLGNALAARLYSGLLGRGVPVWFDAVTEALVDEDDAISGLIVEHGGQRLRLRARCGVILAGGGFPSNALMRERYLPQPVAQYTPATEGCVGDTLDLALDAGATLGTVGADNALWFPSSITRRADGSTAVYPHIVLDRAKPGLVAVNRAGKRFVNEAVSYHEFVRAMYRSQRVVQTIPALLVCDRRFLWKYGLGLIRPMTPRLAPYIDQGYLKIGETLEDLARTVDVDPGGLVATVAQNNRDAATGVDTEFGKGTSSYDRANGDASHRPNPCIGPISEPPFYAVAVVPTPLGTSLGLLTNAAAQVCRAHGQPIRGLYACGNDMHSAFGGEYPGAGAQIGQAMTFAYLAVKDAVGAQQRSAPVADPAPVNRRAPQPPSRLVPTSRVPSGSVR
ncbi:MAG: FAD-binding protein [Proteobacteria bacterium]|nr:FAD-binding protein [Burkholderiales bacterium]